MPAPSPVPSKTSAAGPLPIAQQAAPVDQAELALLVRKAYDESMPIYPIGGSTSLDFGLAPKLPGLGLSLAGLDRVVDYPWQDMTVTLEAGVTMETLARTLAAERQCLPIDAAQPAEATIGGMVATNFSGPRRYGCGTLRDYVIGISAVDGRGTAFKGGGRVVKNVAGYDFCRLLTGSLGSLAVISQVTLKVKPLPEASAFLTCEVADLDRAEQLLAALVQSSTTPTAIELVCGPAWQESEELRVNGAAAARLLVGLQGTRAEVDWMLEQLSHEWHSAGVEAFQTLRDEAAGRAWRRLIDFAAPGDSPLVVKANVMPSAVTAMIGLFRGVDPGCSIQAHAGNGIVLARFAEFSSGDVSRVLIGRLRPAAVAAGGNLVVWSAQGLGELTRQAVWGPISEAAVVEAVKRQFDPRGLLNPGRFVYGTN
ncbi:MAG: FAD-binding oxidoreductase [Pirellulales bacterium]